MSNKEKLQSAPSSFILTLDGSERRLDTNEKFFLDPSANPLNENPLESLWFSVESEKHISLELRYKDSSSVKTNWGMIRERFDSEKRVFQVTLPNSAFHEEEGTKYIIGSRLSFSQDQAFLSGNGWTLEYRPL